MIKHLTTRLSVLKKVSKNASFKTGLMVAIACFISVISNMIAVWGGTESYIIREVQVMQNKAARFTISASVDGGPRSRVCTI